MVPLCWCGEMQMGEVFFARCKFGVLQYVLLKPICCFAEIITHSLGIYGGTKRFSMMEGYIYITIVTTTSQCVALYSLVSFYQNTSQELERWNALPKFACVKLVVFFTYWQGLLLSILQRYGWIHDTTYFTSGQVNHGLQNLCICVEMVVFSFCHHVVFEVQQFQRHTDIVQSTPFWTGFWHMFYVEDFRQDVKMIANREEYQKLNFGAMCGGARYGSWEKEACVIEKTYSVDNDTLGDTAASQFQEYIPAETWKGTMAGATPGPPYDPCNTVIKSGSEGNESFDPKISPDTLAKSEAYHTLHLHGKFGLNPEHGLLPESRSGQLGGYDLATPERTQKSIHRSDSCQSLDSCHSLSQSWL